MSYILRDRSDGPVEVLFFRPILVGLCDSWTEAEQLRVFLKDEHPELPDLPPVNFWEARKEEAEASALDLSDLATPAVAPVRKSAARCVRNLPAPVSQPKAAVRKAAPAPVELTDDQLRHALGRIQQGDSLREVAQDSGVSMFELSTAWDRHRREMQTFMASAGQQPCKHCGRRFTPSISHPETCARCNHG